MPQGNGLKRSSLSPKFSENSELYSMSDLMEENHFPKSPFPKHDEIYNTIANSDITIIAKCYLGAPISSHDECNDDLGSDDGEYDSEGRFQGPSICDPFVHQPYNIIITSIEEHQSLAFTEDELEEFPERDSDPSGSGMMAQLAIAGDHSGVISASGYIKLVRLWTKTGSNRELLEIFEAYLDLDVRFELSFTFMGQRFKGHCNTETHAIAFWAVRARKDKNGQEIGHPLEIYSNCY